MLLKMSRIRVKPFQKLNNLKSIADFTQDFQYPAMGQTDCQIAALIRKVLELESLSNRRGKYCFFLGTTRLEI